MLTGFYNELIGSAKYGGAPEVGVYWKSGGRLVERREEKGEVRMQDLLPEFMHGSAGSNIFLAWFSSLGLSSSSGHTTLLIP